MNTTAAETTPLLVATTASHDNNHHHDTTTPSTKDNNDNKTSRGGNLYLIGIGFSFGMLVSCVVLLVFALGYLLSSEIHGIYPQQQLQSIATSSTDDTMQVTQKTRDDTTGTSFQYVATQFISFTINTMGGLQEHGECHHRTVDPNSGACYLGDVHNITHDIEHRLEIVQTILKRIKADSFQESPDIDHIDNVLKVVSLPEFFWRGPFGAYTIEQVHSLYGYFSKQLQHLIRDDFYNDFVFCFGTIIAARPVTAASKKSKNSTTVETASDVPPGQPQRHATEMEYFNFAPISRGGTNHHSYIVTKQYISTADFLSRSDTLPNPAEENVRDYADFDPNLQAFFQQQLNTTIVQENVIVIDGIRIGIEICLDHRLGVLWNNRLTHHQGADLVDVLLITSAGMAIERGPNPVVPGGVVYLCDGSASSAACIRPPADTVFHPNHVCRGDSNIIGLKHIPIGSPG